VISQTSRPSETRVAALAVVIEELTARLQAGEPVDADEVMREHPEHAGELRELLPTMARLVSLSRPSTAGNASPWAAGESLRALGDFRIRREVGRGGMGIVYEAEQVSLGRR
jgi:eukaryotic-like serine/threonine-protein kinase